MPMSQNIMPQSNNLFANNAEEMLCSNNFMDDDLQQFSNSNMGNAFGFGGQGMNDLRNANFNKEQFEQMESTSEYMETHYYNSKLIGGKQAKDHVRYNPFWSDYALFLVDDGKTQFVTENFTSMTG